MDLHSAPNPSQLGHRSATSTSKRSFPNLQHLSLAPLSSRFPIDGDDFEHDVQTTSAYQFPPSTYISGKSAPSTPGILSRGASPTRPKVKRRGNHGHGSFAHESYLPTQGGGGMTKSKSASVLTSNTSHKRTMMPAPFPKTGAARSKHSTTHEAAKSQANDEWLHRAGLAIASETRVSKGQSWLVSRESSTSLVLSPSAEHAYEAQHQHKVTLMTGEHIIRDDDDAMPTTPRFYTPHNLSRAASCANSRAASRRGSRRGSRVGSKLELAGLTMLDTNTAGQWAAEGYFDDVDTVTGAVPDFVDIDEADEAAEQQHQQQQYDDDREVASLARQRSLGIGGLVDRLVGWTLFNVDEDAEESAAAAERDEEEQGKASAEETARRKAAALKRRQEQLEKSTSSSALATQAAAIAAEHLPPPEQEEAGGWKDAAWLLSVASKVLL